MEKRYNNEQSNAQPAVIRETLSKNLQKATSLCKITPHVRHFCYFASKYFYITNMFSTSTLRETLGSLGFA